MTIEGSNIVAGNSVTLTDRFDNNAMPDAVHANHLVKTYWGIMQVQPDTASLRMVKTNVELALNWLVRSRISQQSNPILAPIVRVHW